MKFYKSMVSVALALTALGTGQTAAAGPYADDLSKCLVRSTGEEDKRALVKWIFSAVALHPDVADIAKVTPTQRDDMTRNTAKLFERLLTESCRTEVRQAVQYEGPQTIGASFQVLGQVAARELFANPAVAAHMAELAKHIDKQKLADAMGQPR